MTSMPNLNKIRQDISKILSSKPERFGSQEEADKANLDILCELKNAFSGDIEVEHDREKSSICINCYAFALELGNSDLYKRDLAQIPCKGKNGVQSDFISYLIKNSYLHEVPSSKNCLVLYFDHSMPRHAGILKEDNVQESNKVVYSRWGNFEAVLTHKLWHVMEEYGSNVKYYSPLTSQESEKYFIEYLGGY